MTRTIDFDAYRAERRAEPVVVRIGGEEYHLPADMPAEVALEVVALRKEHGDNAQIPADKIGPLARATFGEAMFNDLIGKHRLSTPELATLIVQVFGQYSEAMVPNPTAPKGAKRRPRATSSAS